jgi:hypothetical protein
VCLAVLCCAVLDALLNALAWRLVGTLPLLACGAAAVNCILSMWGILQKPAVIATAQQGSRGAHHDLLLCPYRPVFLVFCPCPVLLYCRCTTACCRTSKPTWGCLAWTSHSGTRSRAHTCCA